MENTEITVFGSRILDSCSKGGWGPSQSQEEITTVIRQLLNQRFGDQATISYLDVDDDIKLDDFPEIKKHVDEKKVPLPIIAFGQEPLWAGGLSYQQIVTELIKRGVKPLDSK